MKISPEHRQAVPIMYELRWSEKLAREAAFEKGAAIGEARGEAKGEDKLSRLISHLLSIGKNDEIASATEDAVLRNQLYEKYSIS